MKLEPTGKHGAPLWECDNCKKRDVWGEGWSWHGRMGTRREDQEFIIDAVACSDECAVALRPEAEFLDKPKPRKKQGRKPHPGTGEGTR